MRKKNYIELINVNKMYDNGFMAVENLNLKINSGEFVTLLGPSGCGKTTTLKMIGGFLSPTSGKINVDGKDIKDVPIHNRPTATVFQDYALFPNMNVYQNITYGLKIMRKPINNRPKNLVRQAERVFKSSSKKANSEIKRIEKERASLRKQLDKLDLKYERNPEVLAIKKMRDLQFDQKYRSLEKQLKKKKGQDYYFSLGWYNKLLEIEGKFFSLFGKNHPVNYQTKGMDEVEIAICNLIKWYNFKKAYDIQYDQLMEKYNDLDFEVSYWMNYADQEKEWFINKKLSRKLTKQEIERRAKKVIKMVGLEGNEKKYHYELSGGMQQRVALARAIVVEPSILLLDEPLSALDAKVRKQIQNELRRIHQELGITFILVTHDQDEALSLSDKVVVMSRGKIEQIDTPKNVYESPANEWVANFIGRTNLFDGVYKEPNRVKFKNITSKYRELGKKYKNGQKVKVMIRPEDFQIVKKEKAKISVKVVSSIYKGQVNEITCLWGEDKIIVETMQKINSSTLHLTWKDDNVHIMKVKDNGAKL